MLYDQKGKSTNTQLIEEIKQQSKMNLQINDKTITAIAINSK